MEVRRLIAATAVGAVGVVAGPAAISGGGVAHAAGRSPVICDAVQQPNGTYEIHLTTPGGSVVFSTGQPPPGLHCNIETPPA